MCLTSNTERLEICKADYDVFPKSDKKSVNCCEQGPSNTVFRGGWRFSGGTSKILPKTVYVVPSPALQQHKNLYGRRVKRQLVHFPSTLL